eukprot:6180953-Pleurochrysis_carterae.AAC.2
MGWLWPSDEGKPQTQNVLMEPALNRRSRHNSANALCAAENFERDQYDGAPSMVYAGECKIGRVIHPQLYRLVYSKIRSSPRVSYRNDTSIIINSRKCA